MPLNKETKPIIPSYQVILQSTAGFRSSCRQGEIDLRGELISHYIISADIELQALQALISLS